jgi:hypothetical protein
MYTLNHTTANGNGSRRAQHSRIGLMDWKHPNLIRSSSLREHQQVGYSMRDWERTRAKHRVMDFSSTASVVAAKEVSDARHSAQVFVLGPAPFAKNCTPAAA